MKVWKKNMVAAAVLVTVCAGIYVNWLYTVDQTTATLTDTLDAEKVMSDEDLVLTGDMAAIAAGEDVQTTAADYFAAVRLSRQQARDQAVNLLQEAMAYDTAGSKEAESSMELIHRRFTGFQHPERSYTLLKISSPSRPASQAFTTYSTSG